MYADSGVVKTWVIDFDGGFFRLVIELLDSRSVDSFFRAVINKIYSEKDEGFNN